MSQKRLTMNLSTNQIRQTKKQLESIKTTIKDGSNNFVKYATERLCELFKQNCSNYNIKSADSSIFSEYNEATNTGIVYTKDLVIIFNEFGTGIKGTQDDWANKYGYEVNKSGKGESGWWYPTDEADPNPYKWRDQYGQLRALTHGLESRHMLYDAYMQLQSELDGIVEMTIGRMIGDLY